MGKGSLSIPLWSYFNSSSSVVSESINLLSIPLWSYFNMRISKAVASLSATFNPTLVLFQLAVRRRAEKTQDGFQSHFGLISTRSIVPNEP